MSSDKTKYVAHVKRDGETDKWSEPHSLEDHLRDTAKLAGEFAADSIGSDWAELAGKWHDLGKYRKRFQDYIRINAGYEAENAHIENNQRAPHSTAGAIHAVDKLGNGFGHMLAYLIAGHHAGLPDWYGNRGSLSHRLIDGRQEYKEALTEDIPGDILDGSAPDWPDVAKSVKSVALWMRMLFSCLVDADFLDTERYMQPERSARRDHPMKLADLYRQFRQSYSKLQQDSEKSELNTIRNEIHIACVEAAKKPPGLFSLTVPTGGGKTLASLAFALEHATRHGKRRIVYAIPFTSIIEQNAKVFREHLGAEAVLEHHSNLDTKQEKENARSRIAAENWDALLIVTTNVQIFESLHASRPSRCRKLHNLVNSVIILDEAQQLPRDFHAPITRVMQQMAEHFGVTWVLCTATQPELGEVHDNFGRRLLEGLDNVREIIPNPAIYFEKLKRVKIEFPAHDAPANNWEGLAEDICQHECVLAIVNTRKQARCLAEKIGDDCLHLSANMCAEHRSEVLDGIKQRLEQRSKDNDRPLRVVSTQLIEAGVDVDFPVVYRAMAGLDSIAQSAGRCNREGRLNKPGRVIVFKTENNSPPGFLKQGEEVTTGMLATGQLDEHLTPEMFVRYFNLMNNRGERDRHGIEQLLTANSSNDAPLAIQFREAAEKFRLIDETGEAVIVPFTPDPNGKADTPIDALLGKLEQDRSQKWVYRKLQRYTVTLPRGVFQGYLNRGMIEDRAGLWELQSGFYDRKWGVNAGDVTIPAEECVY